MNNDELEAFYTNLIEILNKNPNKFKLDKKTKEKFQEINIFNEIFINFPDKYNSILSELMSNFTLKKYEENDIIFENNIKSINEIFIIFMGELNIDNNNYTIEEEEKEEEEEIKSSNLTIKDKETFTKKYLINSFQIEKKINENGELCLDENCFFKITSISKSIVGFLPEKFYKEILEIYKIKERIESKYFLQRIEYFPHESNFIDKFQKILIKRCFPRQSIICEQNDEIKSVYLISRGLVRLSITFNKKIFCSLDYNVLIGKRITERFYSSRTFEIKGNYLEKELMSIIDLGEGEILGGIEICKNLRNFLFKKECVTDVTLYEIKIEEFKDFMENWKLNRFYDKINNQLNIIRERISKIRNFNQEKSKNSDFNFFQNKFITTYKQGHPINVKAKDYINKYTHPFNFGKIFRSKDFKTINTRYTKSIDFDSLKESHKNKNINSNIINLKHMPFITNIINENLSQEFPPEKGKIPPNILNLKYKKQNSKNNFDNIFIKAKENIKKNEEEKGKKSCKMNNLLKLKNNRIYVDNFLNKNRYNNRRRVNSHKVYNRKKMKISNTLIKPESKKDINFMMKSFSNENNLTKKMHLSLDNLNYRYHLNDEEIRNSHINKQKSSSSKNNLFIPKQNIKLMLQKMKEFPRPSINKKKLTFPHGIQAINNIDEIIHEIINNRLIKREFEINNKVRKRNLSTTNKNEKK